MRPGRQNHRQICDPGAGHRLYEREDDPKPRSSPLKPAWPDKPRGIGPAQSGNVGNKHGQGLPPDVTRWMPRKAQAAPARAILVDGDYLIYARRRATVFTINKKTWKVKSTWPVPGNRTTAGWGKTKATIWSSVRT